MTLPYELDHVRKRPSMWLRVVNFDTMSAFLQGANMASNGGLLSGFREWLVMRLDRRTNIPWFDLVLVFAFPDAKSPKEALSQSPDQRREIDIPFELFSEFWHDRQEEGLKAIYLKHEIWSKEKASKRASSGD